MLSATEGKCVRLLVRGQIDTRCCWVDSVVLAANPFEILGVPLDADDAAVRRAYARKVREHPPESDAEGFQRIAEAFEAIRTAEARAALRSTLERPELAALMRGYQDAADPDTAWRLLESIVTRFPDFTPAREEQLRFLAGQGRVDEAIAHAEAWAAVQPRELAPLLHIAHLLLQQERAAHALAVAERAVNLAPGDRRAYVVRIRALMRMDRSNDALAQVEAALQLPVNAVSDAELLGRRVLVLARLDEKDRIDAQVEQIAARAHNAEDRRGAAGLLTSLAGYVLTNGQPGRVVIAEKLFKKAGALDPEGHRFVLESRVDAKLDRMRADVQEHVARVRKEKPASVLPTVGRPSLGQASGCFLGFVLGAIVMVVGSGLEGKGYHLAPSAAPFVAAALVLAGIYRSLLGTKGPELDYFELRPLSLVRVHRDTVAIIPLLRITELDHVGSGTIALKMDSGETILADALATHVGDFVHAGNRQIHRLTQLASDDLLETELQHEPLKWDPA